MAELENLDIKFGAKQSDVPALEGDTLVFVREKQIIVTSGVRELTLDDAEQFIVADTTNGGFSIKIPTNADVPFPIGTEIAILRYGASGLTIIGSGSIAINGDTDPATRPKQIQNQWGTAAIRKIDSDAWIIAGDI